MRTNIQCHRVQNIDAIRDLGDFCYSLDEKTMTLAIPGVGYTQLRIGGPDHPFWTLTGPMDRPTLNPSIHAVGIWHGWLRDGVLTEC